MFLWWFVDSHDYRLIPPADVSAPACSMGLTGFLVDIRALLADRRGGTAVALIGRDELDAAVPVPVVVPVHNRGHPLARLVLAGERSARVIRSVFRCSEQRFRIWVVVADARP